MNNTDVAEEPIEQTCHVCGLSNKLIKLYPKGEGFTCILCAAIDTAIFQPSEEFRIRQRNMSHIFHVVLNHSIASAHNIQIVGNEIKAVGAKIDMLISMLVTAEPKN